MGFFGAKKKQGDTFTSTAANPNRHYVAPIVPNSKNSTTGTTATAVTAQKRTVPLRDPPVGTITTGTKTNTKGDADLLELGGTAAAAGGATTGAAANTNTEKVGAAAAASSPNAIDLEHGVAVVKTSSRVGNPSAAANNNNAGDDEKAMVTLRPLPYPNETVNLDKPELQNLEDLTADDAPYDKNLRTVRTKDSADSKDTAFTITRNGQYLTLNGFANGHLIRWKFAAEEGTAIIRIPALLLAIGTIFTTIWPIVTVAEFWSIPVLICAFHACSLSLMIIVLEGRAVTSLRSPTNARARLRNVITRYLSVLKFVWGRGLLYIYAASMNLTLDHEWVIYTSLPLIAMGIFSILAGGHASYNLDQLKSSLTDESYLWVKFSQNDPDNDGLLDTNGFAELLWSLGLEFDDMYTYKAFKQIDHDSDGYISFDDFKHWWIVTQNDGKGVK